MDHEIKNLLRAQSKYGLMGSSAKTGKKIFQGSQEYFLHRVPFGIGHPPTYTSNAVYMCAGGFKGPKSSNRNSIILIHSKVMVFLVILLSPHGPRGPHIIPVVPTSSLSSPHCPHSPQKVPMWSPWLWSPWSPPHVVPIVPVVPMSSPLSPHHPHII